MRNEEILLDPTNERSSSGSIRSLQQRPTRLDRQTVGLVDISKPRGDVFLERLDELLRGRGISVKRYRKPTYARPAPVDLQQQIVSECEVVVEGLADCGSCTSSCVHDLVNIEGRGRPAVGIVSTEFREAWAAQSEALGLRPDIVFVQHPIADRSDEELRQMAEAALDRIMGALTGAHAPN